MTLGEEDRQVIAAIISNARIALHHEDSGVKKAAIAGCDKALALLDKAEAAEPYEPCVSVFNEELALLQGDFVMVPRELIQRLLDAKYTEPEIAYLFHGDTRDELNALLAAPKVKDAPQPHTAEQSFGIEPRSSRLARELSQPESAGDARELADLLFHCDNPTVEWFAREINAYFSSIRAVALDEVAHHIQFYQRDKMPSNGIASSAVLQDMALSIRSLKPTGAV